MTGVALNGRTIDLGQLQRELQTAGVTITAGLGSDDANVWTFDQNGQPADFQVGQRSLVRDAIDRHVPDTSVRDELAAGRTYLQTNYQTARARIAQIRNAGTPTNAQAWAAIQDLALILDNVLRYIRNKDA